MFRRNDPEEDDRRPRRRSDRGFSTKVAAFVLAAGAALLIARASVATVVRIHGDGMAPTILDGDYVMVLRGAWSLEAGDIVVYDPTPPPPPEPDPDELHEEVEGGQLDDPQAPDPRRDFRRTLPNTAVVDVEELEENWDKVQKKSGGLAAYPAPKSFRVGRIIAVPGDTVTFYEPNSPVGLAVNGQAVEQKPGTPLRLKLKGRPVPGEDPVEVDSPRMRSTAYESHANKRYPVLARTEVGPVHWPALSLPPAQAGPVEIEAEGYLVLADNRDEGSCCDSRAIGWVHPARIRGELALRLAGDPSAAPDLAPEARGPKSLP